MSAGNDCDGIFNELIAEVALETFRNFFLGFFQFSGAFRYRRELGLERS